MGDVEWIYSPAGVVLSSRPGVVGEQGDAFAESLFNVDLQGVVAGIEIGGIEADVGEIGIDALRLAGDEGIEFAVVDGVARKMIAVVAKIAKAEKPIGSELMFEAEIPCRQGRQVIACGEGPVDSDRNCEGGIGPGYVIAAEGGGEWIGHTGGAVRVLKAGIGEAEERSERSNAAEAVDLVGIRQRVVESGATAEDRALVDTVGEPEARGKLRRVPFGAPVRAAWVTRVD